MIIKHENLPAPQELKRRLNKIAALNIIMTEESESWLRVCHKVLDPDGGSCIFSIDNGSGDNVFIVFSEDGCMIKGFDHESFFSPYARDEFHVWSGIYDDVPQPLLSLLDDPMYEKEVVTFCVWRETTDTEWQKGEIENPDNDDDGMNFLLAFLFSSAEDYREWAKDYYEKELPLEAIELVYIGEEITEELVAAINPERDVVEVLKEIKINSLDEVL
jgi:hypothetical protein